MKLIPKWYDLKKIGDTKFVNSMYIWIFLVPFLAKAFEYISVEKFDFFIFQQMVPISTSLPFSWVMFYFCALSLALGKLIYIIRCPKIIKDHPTYQSFLDEGKKLKQLHNYSDDISFNWEGLLENVSRKLSKLQSEKQVGMDTNAAYYSNLSIEDPLHYFWPIHESAETKYLIHRIGCFTLFLIGFALFGIVVIQNTIAVIHFVIK